MSLSGSESSEHLSGDSVHGFVTVIPVDYSRHRGFLQPPDQYSDFKSKDSDHDRIDCLPCVKYTQIDDVNLGYKSINSYDNHMNHSDWDNVQKVNSVNEQTNVFEQTYHNMKVCVYMMTDLALRMDIEDGTNATVQDLVQSITQEEQLRLPRIASTIFTLWMSSGLLELQLKPHHKPLHIRNKWPVLLAKYAHASDSRQRRDEPVLSFKRNVFYPLNQEERIKDEKILELLYAEAKYNILEGRYPCDVAQYIMLGSIQARIELGPYNPQYHTLQFFREQQGRFLPSHIRNMSWNSCLRLNSKDAPEVRLLEQYRRLPDRKLHKKYLEFCWTLPYYGAAFFQGQIEQPVRGLKSLITHQDIPVLVGINGRGVYIINNIQCTLLVGLKYEELSWDFAKPSQEDNPDCLPCLFLQFRVVENGTKVSKILQIFSKQAGRTPESTNSLRQDRPSGLDEVAVKSIVLGGTVAHQVRFRQYVFDSTTKPTLLPRLVFDNSATAVMMDALITGFVEELKLKLSSTTIPNNSIDRSATMFDNNLNIDGAATRNDSSPSFLTNKLRKLTLATFDEEGRCIGQMGSWSFSY